MKKRKSTKVKRIKQAIGRLRTPPPQVIPDKRKKLREEADRKQFEEEEPNFDK